MSAVHDRFQAPSSGPAALSVVVPTLNGAARLPILLAALDAQTIAKNLEVIVVDDGSQDDSSKVAAAHGAKVVSHETNRGVSAARNTGIAASHAPWVAFIDDDCEPEPSWAEQLLAASRRAVVGVGGAVTVAGRRGYMLGYLERNNPAVPLEAELASSTSLPYRFWRYLMRNLRRAPAQAGPVYAFAGPNMAFDRAALEATGGFDERFTFGAEDTDLCLRLLDRFGNGALWFDPAAVVRHHFDTRPRVLLRRRRAYGYGVGRLFCKRHELSPTIYPLPILAAALLLAGLFDRRKLLVAALVPQAVFARGLFDAFQRRSLSPIADCYVRLVEEAFHDLGWAAGAWQLPALDCSA